MPIAAAPVAANQYHAGVQLVPCCQAARATRTWNGHVAVRALVLNPPRPLEKLEEAPLAEAGARAVRRVFDAWSFV